MKTKTKIESMMALAFTAIFSLSACSKVVTQTNALSKNASNSTIAKTGGSSGGTGGGSNSGGSGSGSGGAGSGSGTGSGSGSGSGGSGGGGDLVTKCWQGALTAFLGISSAEAQEPAVCSLTTSQFINLLVPALTKSMATNTEVTNQIQQMVKAELAKTPAANPMKLAAKYAPAGVCVPVPPGDLNCPIAVLAVPNPPPAPVDPKRCFVSLVSPMGEYAVTSIEMVMGGGGALQLRYSFAAEASRIDFAPGLNPPNALFFVPAALIPRFMASGMLALDQFGAAIGGPISAYMSCW